MTLYDFDDPGPLRSPAMVVGLEGWVNAGSAATLAAGALAEGGDVVATFDADSLFDYRMSRPSIDFDEGVMDSITWPELLLVRRPLETRDLLVLTGTEPSWNWRKLAAQVSDLAAELGVVEHVSVGGIPWAAPHTRPVSMITTASRADLLAGEHPEGILRVPGSAVSVIEHAVSSRDIPAVGFWARVPHYVGSEFHAAALALVERVKVHLGVEVPVDQLAAEVEKEKEQIDVAVATRSELRSMVTALEEMVDQEEAVSGDRLAAEIERFLRGQE